jgi:hypothetical protein
VDYAAQWPTIAGLFLGIFLITVGFSLRSRGYGVFLLWLGQAVLIGVILFHIFTDVSG